MIGIILSLVLVQETPAQIDCPIDVGHDPEARPPVIQVIANCPAEFDGLQSAADAAIEDLNTRVFSDHPLVVPTRLAFVETDAGWAPVEGQVLLTVPLEFPHDMLENSGQSITCTWSARPDRRGVPERVETRCFSDDTARHEHIISAALDALNDVLDDTRFLPTNSRYCHQAELRIQASGEGAEFGVMPQSGRITAPSGRFASICD
ncbi:hypothetical protein [Hyphobacterium sp.]|uniref:hypothetical protein n=1 Tax=Hyphobacterium sp. TaxID=2004662 RepID=UPI003BABDAB2